MTDSTTFNLYTLIASGAEGVAFSSDQSLIYAAKGGDIQVFDVATHALVETWHVGKDLGSVSVAPDGSFLLSPNSSPTGPRRSIASIPPPAPQSLRAKTAAPSSTPRSSTPIPQS